MNGVNSATIYDKKNIKKYIDSPVIAEAAKDENLEKARENLKKASYQDVREEPTPYEYPELIRKTVKDIESVDGKKIDINDKKDYQAVCDHIWDLAYDHKEYLDDLNKFEKDQSKWSDAFSKYDEELMRVAEDFTGKYADKKLDSLRPSYTYKWAVKTIIEAYDTEKTRSEVGKQNPPLVNFNKYDEKVVKQQIIDAINKKGG
jgi:hypothetical protein